MKTCKEPRKLGSLFFGVRSLTQKVRNFIVDFVDRLKQYAVDYAVDQDRTEILAMQSREQDAAGTLERIARTFDLALESAREKAQSDTKRVVNERADAGKIETGAEAVSDTADRARGNESAYEAAADFDRIAYRIKAGTRELTKALAETAGTQYDAAGLKAMLGEKNIHVSDQDAAKLNQFMDAVRALDMTGVEKIGVDADQIIDAAANGAGTVAHSLRRDTFGLSKKEFAQFYAKIAEVKIEKNPQFQNAPDGSYIFDIENKLVYTDGDWEDPTIRRVVSFDLKDGTMLHDAKDFFTELETDGADYGEIKGLLAYVYGKEVVSLRHQDVRDAAEGQDRGRARKDADGAGRDNRADLPSEGKRKFSLKNESADKVDVDQTLRAGDSSMAGQTEAQEQTRHEPVDVTDKMRQWADKRAGQIIREYRSTIDGASVREDMAKLVSELAENGASSDALNATVNMAKDIIEKRSAGNMTTYAPMPTFQSTSRRGRQSEYANGMMAV